MKKKNIANLPDCDFCGALAKYDAPTRQGPWAYMCQGCYPMESSPVADKVGFEFVEKTVSEKQMKAHSKPQEKIPVVTLPLTWDSVIDVMCPFCDYPHSVEPDANYVVTCEGCEKKYEVRSLI